MNNFNRILLLTFLFWSPLPNAYGQSYKATKKASITVHFMDNTQDTVVLCYYKDRLREYGAYPDTIMPYPNKANGKLHFTLEDVKEPGYLTLLAKRHNLRYKKDFLVEGGDRVSIIVTDGSMSFAGVQSEKYECLYRMDSILQERIITKRRHDLADTAHNTARDQMDLGYLARQLNDDFSDSLYGMAQKFLQDYRNRIAPLIYDVIANDLFARNKEGKLQAFRIWWPVVLEYPDSLRQHQLFKDFFRQKIAPDTLHTSMDSRRLSYSYVNFIVSRAYYDNRMEHYGRSGLEASLKTFDQLAGLYAANCLRNFREKVLTTVLLTYPHSNPAYISRIDSLQKVITNKSYTQLLERLKAQNLTGVPAFCFSLPDSLGKRYSLSDFSGKVVLVDFWFSGCQACIKMTHFLQPVFDHFRNNPGVIFLSVSVDRDSLSWAKSLRDKEGYADRSAINLFTEGMGEAHPFVKYYGYYGFPQLMLIDAKGRIISANVRELGNGSSEQLRSNLIKVMDREAGGPPKENLIQIAGKN